jgi:biotin operon repressor
MNRGYVKVWRKIEDSGLIQLPNTLALFMHLLLNATHKSRKIGTPTGVVLLQRGQYISGRIELARKLKQSEREIRTSVTRLVDLGIVSQKTTNRYSIYTIENYALYQDIDQPNDQQATSGRPADDQQATTKQELKNLSIEEEKHSEKKTFSLPSWVNKSHWDIWHSKGKRKAASVEQKQLAVDKLTRWKEQGLDYGKALEDAAEGGWQGLHEPKPKARATPKSTTVHDKRSETAKAMFGDRHANSTGRIIDVSPEPVTGDSRPPLLTNG